MLFQSTHQQKNKAYSDIQTVLDRLDIIRLRQDALEDRLGSLTCKVLARFACVQIGGGSPVKKSFE